MAEMKARLYIRLPDELFEAIEKLAERRYMSKSDVAREAIAQFVVAQFVKDNANDKPVTSDNGNAERPA